MKLSKIHTCVFSGTGVAESSIELTVEYNPATKEVEQIISAIAFNEINRTCTDITSILYEQFGSPLESMVDSIDWTEVYAEVMAIRGSYHKYRLKQTTNIMSQNQLTIKSLFDRDDVKQKFREMLGKRATSFMTSVLQIAAQNSLLAKADPVSIYQAAAVAATLDLPLNQNLGFAYIVPYNQKYKDDKGIWQTKQVAQFQMGYKGFIQLAQRSGQFKSIYSTPVYEGQILEANPLDGYVFDFSKKTSDRVIGYAARFKLLNGFEATWYMDIDQVKKHGSKYSKTFGNEKGLWNTDFDSMASKTVIKLLLSKFAPLSVDMQKAVITDQSVINDADTQDVTYIDNDDPVIDKEAERVALMINDASTVDELKKIQPHVQPEQQELFETKFNQLSIAK